MVLKCVLPAKWPPTNNIVLDDTKSRSKYYGISIFRLLDGGGGGVFTSYVAFIGFVVP